LNLPNNTSAEYLISFIYSCDNLCSGATQTATNTEPPSSKLAALLPDARSLISETTKQSFLGASQSPGKHKAHASNLTVGIAEVQMVELFLSQILPKRWLKIVTH